MFDIRIFCISILFQKCSNLYGAKRNAVRLHTNRIFCCTSLSLCFLATCSSAVGVLWPSAFNKFEQHIKQKESTSSVKYVLCPIKWCGLPFIMKCMLYICNVIVSSIKIHCDKLAMISYFKCSNFPSANCYIGSVNGESINSCNFQINLYAYNKP